MRLREALDRCTGEHMDDWVEIPGQRPATAMVVALFEPGGEEPGTRALAGHSIGAYEPDPRLTMVWPVPEDDDLMTRDGRRREKELPDFAEEDSGEFKSGRASWVVILFNGTPVWQELLWYLDWGSGIGGYVANIRPEFGRGEDDPRPTRVGWKASKWSIGLADLVNYLADSYQWWDFDPTNRLVPAPSPKHPIDAARPRH
jgi:hypothetical protein